MVKNLPADVGGARHSLGLVYPGRRKWQPAPVFLPGKFHGQRSLASYSTWGCKESDTTEHAHHVIIVIIKYELCCTIYPCSLFYASWFIPHNPLRLSCPFPLHSPSWQPLVYSLYLPLSGHLVLKCFNTWGVLTSPFLLQNHLDQLAPFSSVNMRTNWPVNFHK